MPDYVPKALSKFHHVPAKRTQHAPHPWNAPAYGQKYNMPLTTSPQPLTRKEPNEFKTLTEPFSTAVVLSILPSSPLSTRFLAKNPLPPHSPNMNATSYSTTSTPTDMLSYATTIVIWSFALSPTQPTSCFQMHASVVTQSLRLQTSLLPYLSSLRQMALFTSWLKPSRASLLPPLKLKLASFFLGAQEACPIITTLLELGHPQPSTGNPLETENYTATDILTAQVRMKRSKAFDMRYHWIRDMTQQKQFNLYWAQGKLNRADYFTKKFPSAHHKQMRYQYIQKVPTLISNCITSHARGCVPPSIPRRSLPRVINVYPTARDSLFSFDPRSSLVCS